MCQRVSVFLPESSLSLSWMNPLVPPRETLYGYKDLSEGSTGEEEFVLEKVLLDEISWLAMYLEKH